MPPSLPPPLPGGAQGADSDTVYREFWDQWSSGYLEPESEYGTPRYVDYCGLAPDHRVLEIGCGSGITPRLIIPRVRLAVFCDMHKPALETQLAQGPLNCALADGCLLPFADASFDRVLIRFTIHNLPGDADREAMLAEAARVLAPGGRLVLAKVPHRLGGYLRPSNYRSRLGWKNWILRTSKFFHPQSVSWLRRAGARHGLELADVRRTPLRSFDPAYAKTLRLRLWQYYTFCFLPLFTSSPLIYDYLDLQFAKA